MYSSVSLASDCDSESITNSEGFLLALLLLHVVRVWVEPETLATMIIVAAGVIGRDLDVLLDLWLMAFYHLGLGKVTGSEAAAAAIEADGVGSRLSGTMMP